MPALKQIGKFISEVSTENITFEEHEEGIIHIIQGNEVIAVYSEEFRSFLGLAEKWFTTSEMQG